MGQRLLKWMLVGIILACITAVTIILRRQDHRSVILPAPTPATPPIQIPPADELKQGAERALRDFFEAPSLEDRAACVRDSPRLLPLMRNYYQQRGKPFEGLDRILGVSVVERHGAPWVLLQIRDHSGQTMPVAVEWQLGRYRVDWESFTAYGSMDWIEFVERKPTAPQLLRLYLGRVPEKFSSDGKSGHFRAKHRDDPDEPVEIQVPQNLLSQVQRLTDGKLCPVTVEANWQTGNLTLKRICYEGWSQ
jgi:hypothetical protein